MSSWVDCKFYSQCLGSCERCKEPGNICYIPGLDDTSSSDAVHDLIMDEWFGNNKEVRQNG